MHRTASTSGQINIQLKMPTVPQLKNLWLQLPWRSPQRSPRSKAEKPILIVLYYGLSWEKNNIRVKDMHSQARFSHFSSVTQSCPTLCNPMDWSMPGFPVHHQLPELAQSHVHRISDVIQPSHPLLSPSPPAFSLFQHQGLFQWVSSLHQVAKVLEFQLQHQSFQWIFRTDFL